MHIILALLIPRFQPAMLAIPTSFGTGRLEERCLREAIPHLTAPPSNPSSTESPGLLAHGLTLVVTDPGEAQARLRKLGDALSSNEHNPTTSTIREQHISLDSVPFMGPLVLDAFGWTSCWSARRNGWMSSGRRSKKEDDYLQPLQTLNTVIHARLLLQQKSSRITNTMYHNPAIHGSPTRLTAVHRLPKISTSCF
ncbi:hypothetical protein B0H13DRAFT_2657730 [Mycena leptocephala]|nr:hypothetical protein B0H13DRAFT_2657730 [Mycena leptocephala]